MNDLFSYVPFRFVYPAALLLLLLVPWGVWQGLKVHSLSRGRRWTVVILRSVSLVCLVCALAGIETVKTLDRLAVFFLLDQSYSVPDELRRASVQMVNNVCAQFQTGKDQSGVIVFGEQAGIELGMGHATKFRAIRSLVRGDQTNLASAMRLAMSAFPKGTMKRMVILSDGNETQGHAIEEAKIAQSAGIAVDVLPLVIDTTKEVRVKEVNAPNRVKADEPFQLRAVVQADQDCEATLRIFQRLPEGRRALTPRTVTLQKGDNVFLLTQELHSAGFYEYDVVVESDADTVKANNEGHAFTMVQGEPTVLYVETDPAHSAHLKPALEHEGLKVVQTDPAGMPSSLAGLASYDALICSNVSAADLNADQLKIIETAVRDLGIGLVMIGGPDAFGAGGLLGTPVEAALPVDMDIRQRKILPRGALVLIMHTCEIPDGNVWAREIGLAALNTLSAPDLMGAIGYMHGFYKGDTQLVSLEPAADQRTVVDNGYMPGLLAAGSGHSWIFPVQPVGDKTMMRRTLTKAASYLGDMPDTGIGLNMAYHALVKEDAAVKRVVMISDGDPAAPTAELLTRLNTAKVAVSTVCIAPHSPNDVDMLRWVANQTGGQFYHVTDPRNLPQIFTKEAAVVKRGILMEQAFAPRLHHDSEVLAGLAGKSLPTLRGHVLTTPKERAVVPLVSPDDDPVLAHWRYGLGKSVAFTSDVTGRWAAEWLRWEGFNRFWAQAVRWAMRENSEGNFRVDTRVRDGKGHIRVDAVDEQGRFVNFLKPRAVVAGPAPEFARHDVELTQTGPGIYEASFPLGSKGAYVINIAYSHADGSSGLLHGGLSLGYSREYEHHTTNLRLLNRIVATSGGRMLGPADNPFTHDLKIAPTITSVWQYLAVVAVLLLPVEIFVRRVVIDFSAILTPVRALLKKIPGLAKIVSGPSIAPGPVTGRYAAATRAERTVDAGPAPESFGSAPPEVGPISEDSKAPAAEESREPTRRLLDVKKRVRRERTGTAGEEGKEPPGH
ncbi:MAG: VWA domain-containing protein [Thermodesulfobacteriota bacterium]